MTTVNKISLIRSTCQGLSININISGEFEADQRSQCAWEEGTNPADNKYLPTHGEKQEQYLVTETQEYTDRREGRTTLSALTI